MKFKEYVKMMNKCLEDNPESAEFDAIYSIDDEGNAFHEVYSEPTVGILNDNEFRCHEDDIKEAIEDGLKVNAICVN